MPRGTAVVGRLGGLGSDAALNLGLGGAEAVKRVAGVGGSDGHELRGHLLAQVSDDLRRCGVVGG